MSFDVQFKQFWSLLSTDLELPDGTEEIMHGAWNKITWPTPVSGGGVVSGPTSGPAKRTGRVTGYNLFMKEVIVELKKDSTFAGTERMKEAGRRWKSLTETEKKEWNSKAVNVPTAGGKAVVPKEAKEKTVRKPSGYNLFMKKKMEELKQAGVPYDQRMTQIGAQWKAMSADQQKIWKDSAVNGSNAPSDAEHEVEEAPEPEPDVAPAPSQTSRS